MATEYLERQTLFIQHLSADAEQQFTSTSEFELAMSQLADMLSASFLSLTTVFKDDHNLEYQFKSHLYAAGKTNNATKYFLTKYPFSATPLLVDTMLSTQNDELRMSKASVFACLLPKQISTLNLVEEAMLQVVPFVSAGELIGMLSYESEASAQFQQHFSMAFHVLKSYLVNAYRMKKRALEVATYQTVLDLMPQRVFWKNRESTYLGCNKAFSDDASLPNPAAIVGVTDHEIFPEQAELYRSDDANTMTTREHMICSEEPQTHQNGETIWLRTSKRPIITDEDVVVGVVGTYDDITQLKSVQQQLVRAKSELEQRVATRTKELSASNQKLESTIEELKSTQEHLIETEKMAALGNLVAGVAHEINTPLGIAVTGTSHLAEMALGLKNNVNSGQLSKASFNQNCDEIIQSSDLILRNLERAAELVRNFKLIAVEQSNDEKQNIHLNKYLNDIVAAIRPKSSNKNIKIFLQGEQHLQLEVYPAVLAQIVTSLVDNALVHGFEGIQNGEIKLSYTVKNGALELLVQDNGRGIANEVQSRIFEPFYSESLSGNKGTGLGLSIVYNLVTQKLNGQVSCRSKVNEFSQFLVTIPL